MKRTIIVGIIALVGFCLSTYLLINWPIQTKTMTQTIHPITEYGSNDYEVLVESLGDQVRLNEELCALQKQKIKKLQQQIEILDSAGLRSCDYLKRIEADLITLQKAIKAATIAEMDIDQVRGILNTLQKNLKGAVQDIETIFLATPVYRVNEAPTLDKISGRYHYRKRVNRFFKKSVLS